MKLSAKTEYACIAVLELAARYGQDEPVRVRDIAGAHGVPARFLVQILIQLKAAGLVASTRGSSGGYRLIRPPEQLTLADVMSVVEGPLERPTSNLARATPETRVLVHAWSAATDAEHKLLDGTTFADLLDRCQAQAEPMYYI